jgi:hypothetical protein
MDENHPVFSTDAYSFSKHIIEEIGDYFWRREGISSLAYRLPFVAPAAYHDTVKENRGRMLPLIESMLQKSTLERSAWFEKAWQDYNAFRATRPYEVMGYARQKVSEMPTEQRLAMMAMNYRANFFTMLDERDSAQAAEKGLTANFTGSHILFINDSQNWTGVESRVLADLFYPDVKIFNKPLVGTETVISIDQARQLIGFEPEYSFGEGFEHA